ncbi:MAG: hypothetical protein IKX57_02060 [Oscillospiraceae bacterium]|nr:hypothetical protein [Oscillospiraceae bacterium]
MALFQKKMPHTVKEGTVQEHLAVMRANYRDVPLRSKTLPQPLWLRLHKNDGLHIIYRDKDLLLSEGRIVYAYLVQANAMLFEEKNTLDLPLNLLYSMHPIAEAYPQFLMAIGRELFAYKNIPEEDTPEEYREMARILAAETDRSAVDFTISMPDPAHEGQMLENVDMHFCSAIAFHKDLPGSHLSGCSFLPVLAAPEKTSAVLILPKEYWTAPYYQL